MKMIIVGAGLGGLSAALCFARRGYDVQVFEQRSDLSPQGNGINVRPGASRIMHRWGLHDDLRRISDPTPTVVLRALRSGRVATRSVLVDGSEHPDWGTMRDALILLLYKRASQAGARITFSAPVADVREAPRKAWVWLKDGSQHEADLVLAADGIRSRIRASILSDVQTSTDPILSDATIYGIKLGAASLVDNPDTRRLVDDVNINTWMGHGCFVVTRWNSKLQTFGGQFGIKAHTDQRGMWDERGDIAYVRGLFADSCTDITAALDWAQSCDRWKLAEMPDLPRWTSKGGRILLLGDSAHAMFPNAAQGFSQTVEDIGVLDYLLSLESDPGTEVPKVAQNWQHIRRPRVERIRDYARWNTQLFLGEPLAGRYDEEKSTVKSLKDTVPDMHAPFHSKRFVSNTLEDTVPLFLAVELMC